MIDAGGIFNVFEMATYTILGTPTGTGGTWLPVADTLNSNTSNITVSSNSCGTLLSKLTIISGNVANIASIAHYQSGLQSSLAVVNGVVSGSGLVLAFTFLFTQPAPQGRPSRFRSHSKGAGPGGPSGREGLVYSLRWCWDQ